MQIRTSLWLAIFLSLRFVAAVSPVQVPGILRVNPKVSPLHLPGGLQILGKAGGQVIARTIPDSAGRFILQLPVLKDSNIDFFCVAPGLDTMYLQSRPAAALLPSLQLLFPCEPDTTASGETMCPKCGREDQVYPMVYGDPIVITRHFDTTGKVSYERTPKKEPVVDTVVRAARFYCRRDKITF